MQALWLGFVLCAALAALAGCAGQPTPSTAALAPAAAGDYQLSSEDMDLDCKDLTGRMQLRILDIRDYEEARQTSAVSRALTSVFAGSETANDPSQRYANDRARLAAYNRRLKDLKCPAFDLDAELQPKHVKETPLPTAPPP